MPDGYWYYLEERRAGRRALALETFYKRPNRDPSFKGKAVGGGGTGGPGGVTPTRPYAPAPSGIQATVGADVGLRGGLDPRSARGVRPEPQPRSPELNIGDESFTAQWLEAWSAFTDESVARPLPDEAAAVADALKDPEVAGVADDGTALEDMDYRRQLAAGLIDEQSRAEVEAATREVERLATLEDAYAQAACPGAGCGRAASAARSGRR
jgi:hypothetical protein